MDTFIRHMIPITNDQIREYRIHMAIIYLRSLIRRRFRWVAEDWLSCMIDMYTWSAIFDAYPPIKVCPKFPWELITHDRSSAPSQMYKDFRGFHSLDNDPSKDLKDNEVTNEELDSALGRDLYEYRDQLLKEWEPKFQAFGEDPVKREEHALNQQAPQSCPQGERDIPASFESTVSTQNALRSGDTEKDGHGNDQPTVSPQPKQRYGDNPVKVHAALVDLWTRTPWFENWKLLGIIASPWEIRLPHETVTEMLLPDCQSIEAMEVEGLLIKIVRRGIGGHTLTLAIEVEGPADDVFSLSQKEFVRNLWKCILKWIITVSNGAMIEWETWRFLWRYNLYPPIGFSMSQLDIWNEFAYTGELIAHRVITVMNQNFISMPKAIRHCEESLVIAGRLKASMDSELADVIASSLPAGYSKADLPRLINKIYFMGRKHARPGTSLEKPDNFFMFAASSIYNLARRNLENEDEESRRFPMAKMLYSRILSSVGEQTS
ncbi:unnamed protein product [Clonostachys byssicola]|uniref:Uncharacterized protein n=1 Tax=Clonostachys byssicola TaxID=160290 RepID=A0A9N9ULJ5_9HYPO|nr:unnamed protein product [Clonostachys byssicola]